MPAIKHETFFRRHPVFTGEEFAGHLSSGGEAGTRTQESLIAYHTRAGRLLRVRRGLFAVIPPGADSDTYPVDPYLVAAKLTKDSVLSHHTALEFHGRAYSVWQQVTYSASRPLDKLAFRSHIFRGTRFPEALRRFGKEHFEVLTRERAGVSVRVASLERTLVDVLDRPHRSGGWEEVWRSLESVEFFDLDRVVEYALLLDNSTTASKVGFFLDQHREDLMVEGRHLGALREKRPRQPHYLDRNRRSPGSLVAEWNLVVPMEVAERSWAEVI
jgi:predicted transcriptional regulator of viral defense system